MKELRITLPTWKTKLKLSIPSSEFGELSGTCKESFVGDWPLERASTRGKGFGTQRERSCPASAFSRGTSAR